VVFPQYNTLPSNGGADVALLFPTEENTTVKKWYKMADLPIVAFEKQDINFDSFLHILTQE
jgi:hypothetical protein